MGCGLEGGRDAPEDDVGGEPSCRGDPLEDGTFVSEI